MSFSHDLQHISFVKAYIAGLRIGVFRIICSTFCQGINRRSELMSHVRASLGRSQPELADFHMALFSAHGLHAIGFGSNKLRQKRAGYVAHRLTASIHEGACSTFHDERFRSLAQAALAAWPASRGPKPRSSCLAHPVNSMPLHPDNVYLDCQSSNADPDRGVKVGFQTRAARLCASACVRQCTKGIV